ncbi:hypothetical protein Ct61P_13956 [Colletotrichum tofieldiae]|nr:hypothetical protein Ct61P_13956 [Colletotrichum tofieldiae]
MYATGIVQEPSSLFRRLNLQSQAHYIVCFTSMPRDSNKNSFKNVSIRNGELCRYHLWVFDSPPLVLPELGEGVDVSSVGCDANICRIRGFSKGVHVGYLERILAKLRSGLRFSY